ncbi:MAG: CHRD domain-containing protein [Burkholderiaceae bacterium]|nr:CHRD domain-containing protein [Burkholderiaceae bacterium]
MKHRSPWLLLVLAAAASAALATGPRQLRADLTGFEEVMPVSTPGKGQMRLFIYPDRSTIAYELSYSGLEADATQAHIHFGQLSVNGGISVFLCTNLDNGPAGTQACPLRSGTVSGVITASSVLGPDPQGIAAGEIDAFVEALRERLTYVNVHTTRWPGGEIRGQIGTGRGGHHH